MKTLLVLVILQLSCVLLASARCTSTEGCESEEVLEEECTECTSSCECESENCGQCQGSEECCQLCCDERKICFGSKCKSRCHCASFSCSRCRVSRNKCCESCCKCKSKKCKRDCGNGCDSMNCNACANKLDTPCCRSCCGNTKPEIETGPSAPLEPIIQEKEVACCSPNITLPNITIIINQSPIYVNNTPIINTNQHCGNYSAVQGNGSHVVYVYANSSCANRTCCRVPMRRPCISILRPPYYYCPPPQINFQCGSGCFIPPPQPAPCYPTQFWPFYQCPTAGCYGIMCYQQQNSGCARIPQWPFYQCNQVAPNWGITYGSPSYSVLTPSASHSDIPISPSGTHSENGYQPDEQSIPPSTSGDFGGYGSDDSE